ncbi:MAG: (2Fe-2S)-binding protein [Deltaproteobacteria bacterium]|nr:(2Fe-2S)-binding protein [Deltaproteobacteria bacterium]
MGHEVGRDTVGAMATLVVPAPLLVHRTYRYCATEACPVVYYGRGGVVLGRQHVRVPVNAKDSGADVPLCYCFAHTRRSVAEKMDAREGPTSALIAREIEAGNCACELRNPTGRCCLGDVRRYEKEVAHRPPGTDFARDRKPRSRGGP